MDTKIPREIFVNQIQQTKFYLYTKYTMTKMGLCWECKLILLWYSFLNVIPHVYTINAKSQMDTEKNYNLGPIHD